MLLQLTSCEPFSVARFPTEILVAYEALAAQSKLPHNTIYNAKRFIGKSLDDPETQAYAAEHPFHVVPTTLSNYSKVGFAVNSTGHPSVITPEQVGIQVRAPSTCLIAFALPLC